MFEAALSRPGVNLDWTVYVAMNTQRVLRSFVGETRLLITYVRLQLAVFNLAN